MKGERIGRANDHRCIHGGTGEPYIRFQLFNEGRPVDPTYHLQECINFLLKLLQINLIFSYFSSVFELI